MVDQPTYFIGWTAVMLCILLFLWWYLREEKDMEQPTERAYVSFRERPDAVLLYDPHLIEGVITGILNYDSDPVWVSYPLDTIDMVQWWGAPEDVEPAS